MQNIFISRKIDHLFINRLDNTPLMFFRIEIKMILLVILDTANSDLDKVRPEITEVLKELLLLNRLSMY